jgi:hypothetical protein
MSSIKFNSRLDTSHHGPPHNARIVTDRQAPQCGGEVPLSREQELSTWGILGVPTGKHPEDSSQVSVEATQWVLLYLSTGHDRCYWEHLAQRGYNVPEHHLAFTTFVLWLPVVHLPVVLAEEISVVVVCMPMWQNLRAYHTITKKVCSHIVAKPLLVSTQSSFSYNSQIVSGQMLVWIFSWFDMCNWCPKFVRTFQLRSALLLKFFC